MCCYRRRYHRRRKEEEEEEEKRVVCVCDFYGLTLKFQEQKKLEASQIFFFPFCE